MQTQTAKALFPSLIIALVLAQLSLRSTQSEARKAPAPLTPGIPIFLEIIEKDARPKAPGDEYLYFRGYDDGSAEWEYIPLGPSPEASRIHKIHLSEDERNELFGLARGCLESPVDFDPMQRLEEKVMISKIRIRDEDGDYTEIAIHYYSPENPKTQLYFPTAAKGLMRKVSYLRGKYLQEA
jgi:hypothetical protein